MSKLEVGQIAPDFTAESTHGTIHLAELLKESEKGVIVYFYPKASTPGCTKEACDFRDSLNSLKGIGYSVIGISADQMGPLERFADNPSTFPSSPIRITRSSNHGEPGGRRRTTGGHPSASSDRRSSSILQASS